MIDQKEDARVSASLVEASSVFTSVFANGRVKVQDWKKMLADVAKVANASDWKKEASDSEVT